MKHIFFVNMICLEKLDSLIFQIGCSSFSGCAEKTRCSGLPNRIVQFLVDRTYASLNLIFVNLLLCASCITYSHTHFCCTPQMHTYGGSSLGLPLKNVQNSIFRTNLNSIQYAHI
jgi:hypothetical protein